MLRLFTLLLAALPAITSAGPLQDRQEKHEAFDEDLTNAHLTGRQPHKRGISYNEVAFVKLFDHPDSRVHWIYNWDSISPPYDPQREFIPMLWSDHYDHTKRWWANVDKAAKMGDGAIHVLSFNEPDQCGNGGACMKSIPATIAAHKKHIDPLKRRHAGRIKIASPAVTNGERDPNNQPMGLAYLDAFLKGCADCQIDYVAVHWYGPAHDTASFKKHIRDAHHMSGFRKVWVTEFGPQGSEDEQLRFLEEMLPWMDGEGYVFRYAMQWAGRGSLVNEQGSALTRVGHYYNTQ